MKVKGKLIREVRQRKQYNQEDIAFYLGISQSQYSKLENGEASFDIEKLGLLLDQLELNPLEVIEFSEKQQAFINTSISVQHNDSSTTVAVDKDAVRKIVQEELKKHLK